MTRPRFHLAFPVDDLAATRRFYVDLLGCGLGRASDHWLDFDFFGHQITAHVVPSDGDSGANDVDGDAVPIPHFGAILEWDDWHALADRLRPSGNALEFKTFRDDARVFAADQM